MLIGIPKEIKNNEFRVGLVPAGARELCARGHTVLVQAGAGLGSGFNDDDYALAGAEIVPDAAVIFARADLIVKVKEPQPEECGMLRKSQVLFTYLHLAADPAQARSLMESGASCIAYESVTDQDCGLPLLAPMSEVAGKLSVQQGALCLEKSRGGSGILLGGVAGVAPAEVLIIGGGVVGLSAARIAIGMGASVTIVDKSLPRLRQIDDLYGGHVTTLFSTTEILELELKKADLVICGVLVPGAAAPKLVTRAMLQSMKPGSVIVDVAIDQGGCFETSRPTTHEKPTYLVDGIIHYCVTNMPGAVARTSTMALTNATLPFVIALADNGLEKALREDEHLRNGLNVHDGHITSKPVAEALSYPYTQPPGASPV